jgi:hypothetical protein
LTIKTEVLVSVDEKQTPKRIVKMTLYTEDLVVVDDNVHAIHWNLNYMYMEPIPDRAPRLLHCIYRYKRHIIRRPAVV